MFRGMGYGPGFSVIGGPGTGFSTGPVVNLL